MLRAANSANISLSVFSPYLTSFFAYESCKGVFLSPSYICSPYSQLKGCLLTPTLTSPPVVNICPDAHGLLCSSLALREQQASSAQSCLLPYSSALETAIPSWTPWADRELTFIKQISNTRNQARCFICRTFWLPACPPPPPHFCPDFSLSPSNTPSLNPLIASWGLFLTWFLPAPSLWKIKSIPSLPWPALMEFSE